MEEKPVEFANIDLHVIPWNSVAHLEFEQIDNLLESFEQIDNLLESVLQ